MGRVNKTKMKTLLVSKISNISISYLQEYGDKVTGIYLSPYKVGKKKHIEIVIVKDNEELPVLEQENNVKNNRIYSSVCDISDYTLKESWYPDYKYMKDLKGAEIIYDPHKKLAIKQNQLNKSENIKCFSNRDELDSEIVDKVKTKIMIR